MDDFPYVLTAHAARVIAERRIKPAWVVRVLRQPERIEPDEQDSSLRHALGRIGDFEDRVLRVVYNETNEPWRIVTAYFDRTQRKKL